MHAVGLQNGVGMQGSPPAGPAGCARYRIIMLCGAESRVTQAVLLSQYVGTVSVLRYFV